MSHNGLPCRDPATLLALTNYDPFNYHTKVLPQSCLTQPGITRTHPTIDFNFETVLIEPSNPLSDLSSPVIHLQLVSL